MIIYKKTSTKLTIFNYKTLFDLLEQQPNL